ncbi:MAG: hypothetical protein RLZZ126_1996, partial [Pseudomonadota bacterium]
MLRWTWILPLPWLKSLEPARPSMSNLQVGLAVLGGLALAAVVAHGAWKSRKSIPRQADPGQPEPALADLQPNPTEPTLDEPRAEALSPGLSVAPVPLALAARAPVLDALIDSIVPIALDHPVSGEAALAALPATRRVGSKPFRIEGQRADNGQWEQPGAGQHYSAFQGGVQLANRMGSLKDIEFSEFVLKVQTFADVFSGEPEFPEMRDELARARELDQFAGEHDAQLSFTLRARSAAWSPGFVAQSAQRQGFVPGVLPGRLVLPAASLGLPPVLDLQFDAQAALAEDPSQSALREVRLSLDVPQVDRGEQPFVRMRDVARALSQSMDAVLTDDHGQPLTADALDGIGAALEGM